VPVRPSDKACLDRRYRPKWEANDKCWEMEGPVVMLHREKELWNSNLNLINIIIGQITTEDILLDEKRS